MQELYESVKAKLDADATLRTLLHTVSDPMLSRVFKTSVQDHTQAAQDDVRWITFNVMGDVSEPCEQIADVKIVDFNIHVWARENTEEVVEDIIEIVRGILHDANLATAELLAWYCHWQATQQPAFDDQTLTWHAISRYRCMVCLVADLP